MMQDKDYDEKYTDVCLGVFYVLGSRFTSTSQEIYR